MIIILWSKQFRYSMMTNKFTIKDSIGFRELGHTTILVDTSIGKTFQLTETARLIWLGITTQKCTAEIVTSIVNEYNICPNEVENDISIFIKHLLQEGIIIHE